MDSAIFICHFDYGKLSCAVGLSAGAEIGILMLAKQCDLLRPAQHIEQT